MTYIGTKKIYPLFNIFVVKPNDMELFGNLHVFKAQFSVTLCLCADVLRIDYGDDGAIDALVHSNLNSSALDSHN